MGRGRSRSRSRSPPRRKRYDEPRRHHHHHQRRRQSPAPCGLLVRNVALDTRPEDLRIPFEKFGPVKDVYLPKNYYTGEPRGFAFVKFRFPEDAAEAKDRLNHRIVGGREIRIVYAEENRKTPQEMRKGARTSGSSDRHGGRRTLSRSPRRRHHSHSRSPASGRPHSRSRSPRIARSHRSTGRSISPRDHSSHERECKTRGKIRSAKDYLPHDEKGYKSAKRSHSSTDNSPHNRNYKSSRSPTLRENSAHDKKHSRSPGRSISPRKEFPLTEDCKAKQKEVSTGDDYKSNKISLSSLEISGQDNSRGMSIQKISSPGKLSSDYEKGDRSKQRSISPEENGGSSPLHGRNLP